MRPNPRSVREAFTLADGRALAYDQPAEPFLSRIEWDVTEHVGKMARLKIGDLDGAHNLVVDNIKMYDGFGGCLPDCFSMKAEECDEARSPSGMCIFAEGNEAPYVLERQTEAGAGIYCLENTQGDQRGAQVGPGLGLFGIKPEFLQHRFLPRCFWAKVAPRSLRA